MDRCLGQALKIIGAGCTEVPLCRDVVSAAISYHRRKEPLQHLSACILVVAVFDVVHCEGAKLAGEMADVMQQCADDDLFGLGVVLGHRRSLKHVFAHGHGLAQIFFIAAPIEDRADEGDNCSRS